MVNETLRQLILNYNFSNKEIAYARANGHPLESQAYDKGARDLASDLLSSLFVEGKDFEVKNKKIKGDLRTITYSVLVPMEDKKK